MNDLDPRTIRLLTWIMLILMALMLLYGQLGCTDYYYYRRLWYIEPQAQRAAEPQNKAPPETKLAFVRPDNARDKAVFELGRKRGIQECENERTER